jgi:ABC-type sugar transport system ATPase subunit
MLQHSSARLLVRSLPTAVVIFLLLGLVLLGCSSKGPPSSGPSSANELTVSAAVSLKEAFNEIAQLNETRTGTKIIFNYGAREKARALLALFRIEHIALRYPQNMSGGEQQRTALARALASDPAVVLLDEPLSAVHTETRSLLLNEIVLAQKRVSIPFLYVTHNTAEAMRLGQEVVVLHEGLVKETGNPSAVFEKSEDKR